MNRTFRIDKPSSRRNRTGKVEPCIDSACKKFPSTKEEAQISVISPTSDVIVTESGENEEEILRLFDLNPHYGPFLGTDRLERWHRAERFGLEPPAKVHQILASQLAMQANNESVSTGPCVFPVINEPKPVNDGTLNGVKSNQLQELRLFDLNPQYGSFMGMCRMERWERAKRFGLAPPIRVYQLLQEHAAYQEDKSQIIETNTREPMCPEWYTFKLSSAKVNDDESTELVSPMKINLSEDIEYVTETSIIDNKSDIMNLLRYGCMNRTEHFGQLPSESVCGLLQSPEQVSMHRHSEENKLQTSTSTINIGWGATSCIAHDEAEHYSFKSTKVKNHVVSEPSKEVEIVECVSMRVENELRQFDLNPQFGPFVGISRKERFERAVRFGLMPPSNIREVLENRMDIM